MATKEELSRTRFRGILKSTVEKAEKLTATADVSSVAIFRDELDSGWTNYINAFNLHEDTLIGKDEATITEINQEYSALHNTYLSTKLHLGKLIQAKATGGTMNSTMFDQSNHDSVKTTKLPPIKITPFSGDSKDWTEFKATCRSILTDKIQDVHRLQYLKDALIGEPRELIAHILPGDGAYDRAMKLLIDRFENMRSIVNGHLHKLYTIKRDEASSESITVLRKIINTINGLKAAMNCIEIETDTWDAILIYNTSQCLHPASLKAWEERLEGKRSIPSLNTYLNFLETRITIIDNTAMFCAASSPPKSTEKPYIYPKQDHKLENEKIKSFYTLKADFKCLICKKNHLSNRCDQLNRMTVRQRREAVSKSGVCFNCLQPHIVANCPFMPACKKCVGNHHTMLHEEKPAVMLNQVEEISDDESRAEKAGDKVSIMSAEHFYYISSNMVAILATALVPIQWNGRLVVLRAIIDQGSTANLMTMRACQTLDLPQTHADTPMIGIGDSPVGMALAKTALSIGSAYATSFQYVIKPIVVQSIASTQKIDSKIVNEWQHIKRLPLADPHFFEANEIDLLLGASTYAEIILSGLKKGNAHEPVAQHTKLGWIVFGNASMNNTSQAKCNAIDKRLHSGFNVDLPTQLQRLWQIEHANTPKHFIHEIQVAENGLSIVDPSVQIDSNSSRLRECKALAENELSSTSWRCYQNQGSQQTCNENLMEHLTCGHTKKLKPNEIPRYHWPNYCLVKESSTIVKVHTVFDASIRTSNGVSFNDVFYVGAAIQPDLFDQLLQWRRLRYTFSGSIEKTYRRNHENPDYALFQCIWACEPKSQQIETYELATAIFGTTIASFQANWTLDRITQRIEATAPKSEAVITMHANDWPIDKAYATQREVTNILAKYTFNVKRWTASDRNFANPNGTERDRMVL